MHLELDRASITPAQMYARLNYLIWLNRLPVAKIVLVDDEVIPDCVGVTVHDGSIFVKPIIILNAKYKRWGKTLIHEMLHVAEPRLRHGKMFDSLVELFWREAKQKGLDTTI